MKQLSALLAFCLLGGCATSGAPSGRVYSPQEVLAATKTLDGKEILVRGWIGGCENDNRMCGIYSSRRAAIGPEPREWPLPVSADDDTISLDVRHALVRGTYVVTCKSDELTICVEYDGFFRIASIED